MKKMMRTTLAMLACLGAGMLGYAAVTVDEQGLGFVGKGDVQLAFDWNNAQLQANAEALAFEFAETENVCWECEWWTGPSQNRTYHSVPRTSTTSIAANVAYDARKNKQGQVTGFNLNGFVGETIVEGGAIGVCEGGKTLVPGSIVYDATDGGSRIQVRYGVDVRDLAITE